MHSKDIPTQYVNISNPECKKYRYIIILIKDNVRYSISIAARNVPECKNLLNCHNYLRNMTGNQYAIRQEDCRAMGFKIETHLCRCG